jgi:methionyl-tRNA synthetase
MMTISQNLQDIYETDYLIWLQKNIDLLEKHQFNQLDLDNLIEELKDLVKQEKRRVKSLLEQIIIHLLLYQYWEEQREYNGNHWRAEIRAFRTQINDDLTNNLRNLLSQKLGVIYDNAVGYVQEKTKLDNLPQNCDYSLNQLLDINWYPDIANLN